MCGNKKRVPLSRYVTPQEAVEPLSIDTGVRTQIYVLRIRHKKCPLCFGELIPPLDDVTCYKGE